MSLRSMTAFAGTRGTLKSAAWSIEIRSVNNRFLDLSLRTPQTLAGFETEIRDLVQSKVKRGKLNLQIQDENGRAKSSMVRLDEDRVKEAVKTLQKLKARHKLAGEVTLQNVLSFPGVLDSSVPAEDPTQIWASVKKLLANCLDLFLKAREREGKELVRDLSARLKTIEQAVSKVEEMSRNRPSQMAEKLRERVQNLLKDASLPDDERFHREVAFLAEKSDVTEEIVRLRSHLGLFQSKLKSDGELGRELDFLCQEMNREINTIGSKSQHFDITREVILVKGELEKIREQVQNIE